MGKPLFMDRREQVIAAIDAGRSVIQLREGGPDGWIVATGFCKMIMFAGAYDDGTDHSMGTPISRGLPAEEHGPLTTEL